MHRQQRRVAITGIHLLSPLGQDARSTWASLVEGVSGVSRIERFDTSRMSVRIAAELKNFDAATLLSRKDASRSDPFVQYAAISAIGALADSGYVVDESNADRSGIAIGTGVGGVQTIEGAVHEMAATGAPSKFGTIFLTGGCTGMASSLASLKCGLRGPNLSVSSNCATGGLNIGIAMDLIRSGRADFMLAGAAEASINELSIGSFSAVRALSTRNDSPAEASRPFDADRDGFVMGEGAAVLALEEYESAKRRGARIYAMLDGYGASSDAHHLLAPREDGVVASRAMALALADAGIAPDLVDYINAHGTSTPAGDLAETNAIKRCFGASARGLAVSSTKSMTGHLLGASGALEAGIAALCVHYQVAPPTINLRDASPGCDLDYIPNTARSMRIDCAVSNSFAFGGSNVTLAFVREGMGQSRSF